MDRHRDYPLASVVHNALCLHVFGGQLGEFTCIWMATGHVVCRDDAASWAAVVTPALVASRLASMAVTQVPPTQRRGAKPNRSQVPRYQHLP